MKITELIVDVCGADPKQIDSIKCMSAILRKAAKNVNATIVDSLAHKYSPQGISLIILLAESHIYFASWPEHRFATLSIFLCNSKMNPFSVLKYIKKRIKFSKVIVKKVVHKIKR